MDACPNLKNMHASLRFNTAMTASEIKKNLRKIANKEKSRILQGFFKTAPGEYGEGDVFLGITVPVIRKLAKECQATPLPEVVQLLKSPIHEERLLALLLLTRAYSGGDESVKKKIYSLYCKYAHYVNSWDLVDLSAPNIVGNYLSNKSRKPLYEFAASPDLWKRRVAIMSTFHFIRRNDFGDTFKISRILLLDEHDLIHKAVGWMLREVGKRDMGAEEKFLQKHYRSMPRTMLRYAIERFPEAKRQRYLSGKA